MQTNRSLATHHFFPRVAQKIFRPGVEFLNHTRRVRRDDAVIRSVQHRALQPPHTREAAVDRDEFVLGRQPRPLRPAQRPQRRGKKSHRHEITKKNDPVRLIRRPPQRRIGKREPPPFVRFDGIDRLANLRGKSRALTRLDEFDPDCGLTAHAGGSRREQHLILFADQLFDLRHPPSLCWQICIQNFTPRDFVTHPICQRFKPQREAILPCQQISPHIVFHPGHAQLEVVHRGDHLATVRHRIRQLALLIIAHVSREPHHYDHAARRREKRHRVTHGSPLPGGLSQQNQQ